MTPEEMEFDRMLDDFSPWFVEWWGTGVLPVDTDLLPPLQFLITEHLLPVRLFPAKMHPRLTNDEHTKMLKLAKVHQTHLSNMVDVPGPSIYEESLSITISLRSNLQFIHLPDCHYSCICDSVKVTKFWINWEGREPINAWFTAQLGILDSVRVYFLYVSGMKLSTRRGFRMYNFVVHLSFSRKKLIECATMSEIIIVEEGNQEFKD
ncbi:hypothetical protein P8452_61787 [Trifolium repens]|nr:hypothetical protein P8452_61787 [Trifolium repens]